jgi:hypothetical protein
MPNQSRLVTAGVSALQAQATVGTVANGLTAAGSTQATALPLPADVNRFTTVAASTGAILPPSNPGDMIVVQNAGANALAVYPPVGAAINAVATNGAYSVATATPTAVFICVTPTQFIAFQSA